MRVGSRRYLKPQMSMGPVKDACMVSYIDGQFLWKFGCSMDYHIRMNTGHDHSAKSGLEDHHIVQQGCKEGLKTGWGWPQLASSCHGYVSQHQVT
jgi:hypothetical protein